jgi:crotonobetainyl-CoA:carnitine CoA-transferase CaiB-like acyl-CoA transferase
MSGPLAGQVVLDLSRILAGPWATQLLADFGADVIKIENPDGGDDTRHWGPPYLRDPSGQETAESAYFLATNRGKRSVAIDFSRTEGRDLVRRLASTADVFVENFKVGGLARNGLAYDDLKRINPRLIYVSISAFGQDGPRAAQAGYDAMIQGMGGLMSITGPADGELGAGPQKVGVAVSDLMCGMYAVSAILAALHERHCSGVGQYIDLSLLDSQVAWLANQGLNYLVSGAPPGRKGTAHPNIVPYQAIATADGHLMLAVGNDAQFKKLCEVIAAPELSHDPRMQSNRQRVSHRAELIERLEAIFRQHSSAHWLSLLTPAGVPCGPINDIAQVFSDPQVVHRQMQLELPHATGVAAPGIRNPVRFSRTALSYERAPPLLGADTDEVLTGRLGLDAGALAELRAARVIG